MHASLPARVGLFQPRGKVYVHPYARRARAVTISFLAKSRCERERGGFKEVTLIFYKKRQKGEDRNKGEKKETTKTSKQKPWGWGWSAVCECVCVCVRACVRACVRTCVFIFSFNTLVGLSALFFGCCNQG